MILKQTKCAISKPFNLSGGGKLILTDDLLKFERTGLFSKTKTIFEYPLEDIISAGSKKWFAYTLLEIYVKGDKKDNYYQISFTSSTELIATGPMLETGLTVQEWVAAINNAREKIHNPNIKPKQNSLDILNELFAKGKISEKQYIKKKKLILS